MKLRNLLATGISLALLTTISAGLTPFAFAQGKQKAGAATGKRMSPLLAGLKAAELTETQKESVKTISEKYRDERKDLVKPDATAMPGERVKPDAETRKKIADIEAKELAEVKALLTPEQLPKFEAAYNAANESRGNAGITGQLVEKLSLTDAQKTELAPVLKEVGEKMATLRADQTIERREKAAQMLAIWNDAKAKIRPVLTPDQQKTLDEMANLRGGGKRPGGKKAGNL